MSLEGKTVVITGTTGGIGAACARLLHARGARVIATARSLEPLNRLVSELGPEANAVQLDVSDNDSVQRAFREIAEHNGPVDVLVNNAGFGMFERVEASDLDSLERMINVNYFGTVRCTKAVLPGMLTAGSGQIINIASIASKLATSKSAGYAATKHAVLGFTNALRQELRGTGVVVTAVHPGPVKTAFFDIADPGGTYVRNVERFMVTPERVAAAVVDAIERRKAEVHIPGWMGTGVKLTQMLPIAWVNACASRWLKLK